MSAKLAIAKKQVTFTCNINSNARSVYLVGNFNDWNPTKKKMNKGKNGKFQTRLTLAQGEYQYKFIIDGIWQNDPDAQGQAMNPYGTLNSIIRI